MALMNRNDVKRVIEDLTEKPFVCTEHFIETTSGFIITTKEKSKYHRAKPQINADRIRAMSDEELAEFLDEITDLCNTREGCKYCPIKLNKDGFCDIEEWLKSEVKEEA